MFAEDLDSLFDVTSGFAESVTVDSVAVNAIVDLDYVDVMSMESTGPAITLPSAKCSAVTHSSTVVARSVTYKVIEIKPDGTGITVLRLHKA